MPEGPLVALIKDTSVEEVKAAADIVAVVGGRTQLRKAGPRYVARCPFHEERTPSFSVNPVEKFYYCFGCGAKGDVITFVRDVLRALPVGLTGGLACARLPRRARSARRRRTGIPA